MLLFQYPLDRSCPATLFTENIRQSCHNGNPVFVVLPV